MPVAARTMRATCHVACANRTHARTAMPSSMRPRTFQGLCIGVCPAHLFEKTFDVVPSLEEPFGSLVAGHCEFEGGVDDVEDLEEDLDLFAEGGLVLGVSGCHVEAVFEDVNGGVDLSALSLADDSGDHGDGVGVCDVGV